MSSFHTSRWRALALAIPVIGSVALLALLSATGGAGASQPTLTVTPGPSGGVYKSGETVTVSVGPNSFFTPLLKVNILECADPGGTTANLPTSVSSCDGNSIQGGTVLINRDGSFSETGYQIFSLPNAELGEQSNHQPVCDATDPCVLYVGQNQEDFTQPKLFSDPFTVRPSAAQAGTANTTTTISQTSTSTSQLQSSVASVTVGSSTTSPSPAATVSSSEPSDSPGVDSTTSAVALANTGAPADLAWVAGLAGALILTGSAGVRLVTKLGR